MKLVGKLDNWYYIPGGHISGDIYKRFHDGEFITTSRVKSLPWVGFKQHELVETKNSCYVLGEPLHVDDA